MIAANLRPIYARKARFFDADAPPAPRSKVTSAGPPGPLSFDGQNATFLLNRAARINRAPSSVVLAGTRADNSTCGLRGKIFITRGSRHPTTQPPRSRRQRRVILPNWVRTAGVSTRAITGQVRRLHPQGPVSFESGWPTGGRFSQFRQFPQPSFPRQRRAPSALDICASTKRVHTPLPSAAACKPGRSPIDHRYWFCPRATRRPLRARVAVAGVALQEITAVTGCRGVRTDRQNSPASTSLSGTPSVAAKFFHPCGRRQRAPPPKTA